MSRKLVVGIMVLASLVLAQLGEIIYMSFSDGNGLSWIVKFFNPLVPFECAFWFIYAIAIGLVVLLANVIRHRWAFGTGTSFLVAGILGSLILPLFCGIIDAIWGSASLLTMIRLYLGAEAMPAYIFIAFLAAGLGIALGKHLSMISPGTPSSSLPIASRVLNFLRSKLRLTSHQALREIS
ncbi:MAG: hypothetical protein NTX00_04270 [Candidatus Parcubacteria bacterium]|nr:hypothetical protein [Candidatus Parcubacteria bacterium]